MPKIELYPHNQAALNHLEEALKYTRRAAVIQPTGTGKSFVALAFIERRPNNSFLYLAPSTHIFNQLKHHAGHTEVLLHTTMMTYQKLCLLHEDELGKLEPDYIILDEFHRCGADDWGSAVDDHLAEVGHGAGAARAGAVGDAGAAALDDGIVDEARLFEGEFGRAGRKKRDAAHRADALARVVLGQREVEDGRAEPGVEALDVVPFVHAAHRVPVGEKTRLDRFPVLAERRDAAHAGDYDSAHQIMPPLTLMTWRVM